MTNPDFPFAALIILSFIAGFAAAIWLAIAFDRGAREIADRTDD
jgi:hypothetical protein